MPAAATTARQSSPAGESASDVFAFLLELGGSLLATGDAVSDIEGLLLEVAAAYGWPDTRVMVLPTAIMIAGGPREAATLTTMETGRGVGIRLRLDQVTDILGIAHTAAKGGIPPDRGIVALEQVRRSPSPHNVAVRTLGFVLGTVGVGLILRPSAELLPWYVALGLLVAVLHEVAERVPGLTSILPVFAAGVVTAVAFGVSGRYGPAPVEAIIPPLVPFLPGGVLTMATVDLASDEVVAGASRFQAGLVQLALLAIGIVAGATLVGVRATAETQGSAHLLGSWAPWAGVLVFGLGTSLRHSAPRRSLPWLLLVLYAAWLGLLLGEKILGAQLSGFVGGAVVAPLAILIERFPYAPPALVSFLPAFWLLVPGALGLIGFTQLVGHEAAAGFTTFLYALISIIAIALGILVGLRLLRIVQSAISTARHMGRR